MYLQLSDNFKNLSLACQTHLANDNVNYNIHSVGFDLTIVIDKICYWMREQGFGLPEHAQYHRITNHFPHLFLSSIKKTIPLSLVCVFVAIGNRLGLQLSPVNYPRKVLVHVVHPLKVDNAIWVDVTANLGRNILNYQLDVLAGMADDNVDPHLPDFRAWISPASVPTMLVRSANNILNSLRMRGWDDDTSEEGRLSAGGLYGAGCIMALFGGHLEFLSRILEEDNTLLLDDQAIFLDLILPALPDGSLHKTQALADARDRINRRQTISLRATKNIQFAVGICIHHRRYEYIGVITGWDVSFI